MRIRQAVRGVVIDPDDRVLLVRFEFPAGTRWACPGGGIDADETAADALRRELWEEAGLESPTIGPAVWTRVHVIPFLDGAWDGQQEVFHLVRTGRFEPRPSFTTEQLAAEYLHELRWWSLDEIEASSTTFVPAALATHLRSLLDDGPPNAPVDVGV